jgi:DNA polymerase-1
VLTAGRSSRSLRGVREAGCCLTEKEPAPDPGPERRGLRTVLVDADVLVYQAAFSAQQTVEWEPGLFTTHGDMGKAKQVIDDKLVHICDALKADKLVLALSDYSDPWRKRIYPEIKANRAGTQKPVLLHPLREYLHERYTVFQRPTLEGDDVLGILGTHPYLLPGQKIIVTIDKDLKGVPGFHANLNDLDKADAIAEISPADADHFHLLQSLSGDSSDGYPGCPGIGPKRAAGVLAGLSGRAAWEAIVEQYRKKGLGEEVALVNARVARICRCTDYDFKKKSVIIWNPPPKSKPASKKEKTV